MRDAGGFAGRGEEEEGDLNRGVHRVWKAVIRDGIEVRDESKKSKKPRSDSVADSTLTATTSTS